MAVPYLLLEESPGLLYLKLHEALSVRAADALVEKLARCILARHGRCMLLVDVSAAGGQRMPIGNLVYVRLLRRFPAVRVGLCGVSARGAETLLIVTQLTNSAHRVRQFPDEDAARAWLLGEAPNYG